MNALVFDGKNLLFRGDHPEPRPGPDEALIQVLLAGICSTDLEILRGYADFRGVLGHEFVGRVVACEAQPSLVGQRVVGEINVGCGNCDACRAGHCNHCAGRAAVGIRGRDGVFAQLVALPVTNLHPVPVTVPDQAAVFVEPLAAALRIRQQIAIDPDYRIAVIGSGKLGQLVARILAGTGVDLVVVGRDTERRDMVILRQAGISTAVADEISPQWADVVVDCSGQGSGFAAALRLVRPQGTLLLKSTYAGLPQADLSRVVVDEISVVGSRCGPFAPALRMLAAEIVDPLPLVEAVYDLQDGVEALSHARARGVLKVLLKPAPIA